MAICRMSKVLIVSHRSEAAELLEALQQEGICQILNAEEAMVSKDLPEVTAGVERPKEVEGLLNRLAKSISFLKGYSEPAKGLASLLAPRAVIDKKSYDKVVSDDKILVIVDLWEQIETRIGKLKTECESLAGVLQKLEPWVSLETPVEEIRVLKQTTALTGLIPSEGFKQTEPELGGLGGTVEVIGTVNNKNACFVVCMKENTAEVQKLLRSFEFEPVNFESMRGTIAELIDEHKKKLAQARKELQNEYDKAKGLSENLLKLEILHDHYANLLSREQTKNSAPATQYTVVLEGWVKKKDYARLEEIVSAFEASSVTRIELAEDENIPVEIENKQAMRPFEFITRLYGMPISSGVDPTVCLAPFFMLFFGICLADVGYGLVMVAVILWLIKKTQGDKKPLWMFLICAAITIPIGAITGSWFGDAVPTFIPVLNPIREKLMLTDPIGDPTVLFKLAVILGYIQLMTGLAIAFVHNLRQNNYVAAICDNLTWLVMLNCIVIFGLSKAGMAPTMLGKFLGLLAIVPGGIILLFSQRQGRWAGRIGMGAYNLFSTVFYLGDVLSYLRLAALCMVGGGIAMAINIIAKISLDIPYGLGVLAMILVLVFGHALNLVLSVLGAFVHTLRLQYVEYFTKFFVGGGELFKPLCKEYKHIYILETSKQRA